MAKNTITSANSTFVITAGDLFPAAVQIEGFSADAGFSFDDVTTAEVVIGVDGKKSQGYVPSLYTQTITLSADSASRDVFDLIAATMDTMREVITLNGVVTIPGINKAYTLTNGTLTGYKVAPDIGKTLQPVSFTIVWETVKPAVL